MNQEAAGRGTNSRGIHATVAVGQLARSATVEISIRELPELRAGGAYLPTGSRVHIAHLPGQTLEETQSACQALRTAGFEPVPHVPVRAIGSERMMERFLGSMVTSACVQEVLLIAGDYSEPSGPYSCTMDVLRSGVLSRHGLRRVSFAGHPEGHPKVDLQSIRRAESEKVAFAAEEGLEPTLVTQFFFEPEPFLLWVKELRSRGVRARLVAGLSGPAPVTALLRYAMRCGVGPSMKALGARSGSIMKLVQDHAPERVMYALAQAQATADFTFDGLHFFSFGGFRRTCEWLHRMAAGGVVFGECSAIDA